MRTQNWENSILAFSAVLQYNYAFVLYVNRKNYILAECNPSTYMYVIDLVIPPLPYVLLHNI